MSSKQKQVQYIPKQPTPMEVGLAPPRYQPPPQPPAASQGILKPFNGVVNKDNKLSTDVASSKQLPYPQQPYTTHVATSVPNLKLYPLYRQQVPYVGVPPVGPVRQNDENVSSNKGLPLPMSKIPEEDQLRFPPHLQSKCHMSEEELLRMGSRGPTEESKHIQRLILEMRALTESNQRLSNDNQELRDLCCFLDDDRQKGRKLAREWQRFGRYTASVMRQEVSAYQNKLRELDNKQQELIKDNLELKELCLYLDEERGSNAICSSCGNSTGGMRDDGDGSSSSTNADEPRVPTQFTDNTNNAPRRSASRERILHENLSRQRSTFTDQTMQYVRSLELKIKQIEEEKKQLQNRLTQVTTVEGMEYNPMLSGRPEAVVRALQVLEVQDTMHASEQPLALGAQTLQDDNSSAEMDESEKALVREMCNVVWRNMDDGPSGRLQ